MRVFAVFLGVALIVGCGQKGPDNPKGGIAAPGDRASPIGSATNPSHPAAPLMPPAAAPGGQAAAPASQARTVAFDEAFRGGRIAWQPVRNIQLTTKAPGSTNVESFEFVTKIKYDADGRPSADTIGQKTYTWSGREAVFGPGAVIKVTEATTVAEGVIRPGDQWVWSGTAWVSKKAFDDELARSENRVIDQLGGLPISAVIRDPGATADETLAPLYSSLSAQPGDLRAKIKACRGEPKCLPAVAIMNAPQDLGDIEQRFGRFQDKQDTAMLFPDGNGGQQAKPVYWYRYGSLDVGVDYNKPAILAIRIRVSD